MTKTHAEFLKAVQDICTEEVKNAKTETEKSKLENDKQYHIGRTHAAKDILRDISLLKFEDKEAEFLEGLKKDLNHYRRHYASRYNIRMTFEELVNKIEQFQSEVKANENK